MSAGFLFTACCPRCGSELLTEGFEPAIEAPDLTYHDGRCDHCLDVYRVSVSMVVVEPWPVDRGDRDACRLEAAAYANQVLDGAGFR